MERKKEEPGEEFGAKAEGTNEGSSVGRGDSPMSLINVKNPSLSATNQSGKRAAEAAPQSRPRKIRFGAGEGPVRESSMVRRSGTVFDFGGRRFFFVKFVVHVPFAKAAQSSNR